MEMVVAVDLYKVASFDTFASDIDSQTRAYTRAPACLMHARGFLSLDHDGMRRTNTRHSQAPSRSFSGCQSINQLDTFAYIDRRSHIHLPRLVLHVPGAARCKRKYGR